MRQLILRSGIALLIAALAGIGAIAPGPVIAQDATPAADAQLPAGPLGEQITWLVDYINMPAAETASVDLTTTFSPGVLADVPADQLAAILGRLRDQLAPVTVDTATIVTTQDMPPTSANFMLIGRDGTQQPVSMTVAPDSGLISSIWFSRQIAPAPTAEATATDVSTGTSTAAPTETNTMVPTETATVLPTETPTTVPTETPSEIPTETPTELPTETATLIPSETATLVPTETATDVPTDTATAVPTETPTELPTETATLAPTETATKIPTKTPTDVPTETETEVPTETATTAPSKTATKIPTQTPTDLPTETATEIPTETATPIPTETATRVPTQTPTELPTETATEIPTETATTAPTQTPTELPTETATKVPTETQTAVPTETETAIPTETATELPVETATEVVTEEATQVVVPAATEESTEAASPIASPEAATPVASPEAALFGDSVLEQQAAWTWSTLNTDGKPVAASEIEAHVSPELLSQAPAEQISAQLAELQKVYGPFTLDPGSILMTASEPPTILQYTITGQDGTTFDVSVSIDPITELLDGFLIVPGASGATPIAASLPAGISDAEVSFTSGEDTIYGSFMTPEDFATDGASAAVLIISGSGPTDRDGNNGALPLGTNRNLAVTFAEDGIPSLRYDKLGSGQTGLGSHLDTAAIDYELFLQEARDAAAFLAEQPGVDPSKLILVGHSEGALFALALADELTKAGTPPAGVILVAPLSVRYLDILHEQLSDQIKSEVDSGQMTEDAADEIATELTAIVESLRTTGELPATINSSELSTIFDPSTAAFLAQIDKVDPGEVAAGLPADLPVLVLLGAKDSQVTGDQVRHLLDGFNSAGNTNVTFVSLPKADHTLRIVEGEANPAVDYANPDLQFSPQAVSAIDAFLAKHGLAPSAK